ncbi:hypothetical protein ACMZOO_18900 (plasmid) [Catenovulum sp. SX2]|uniref:hypothetical protein n=1 Tax=Catenovulum sp. SX2 TaxID=3398614 RepID=UPI003F85F379
MSKIEQAIQAALEIICQLHNEEKTVSVAAVRNRALLPLPLPAITKAVSAFKENPETYLKAWQQNNSQAIAVEEPEAEQTSELTMEQRVVQLERQVEQLQQALDKLVNKVG